MGAFKEFLNEAPKTPDTRGAISKAFEKVGFPKVKVEPAEYSKTEEFWVLDLQLTDPEQKELKRQLRKIGTKRFIDAVISTDSSAKTTKISVPLNQ